MAFRGPERDPGLVVLLDGLEEIYDRVLEAIGQNDPRQRILIRDLVATVGGTQKQLQYMTEPEIGAHLSRQLRFIKANQTSDTVGSMLVIFGADNVTQYGATIDPETAPKALRELADRIEKRESVKRN